MRIESMTYRLPNSSNTRDRSGDVRFQPMSSIRLVFGQAVAQCEVWCMLFMFAYPVLAQPNISQRQMEASPAICYNGSGSITSLKEDVINGLYFEVRNQGQPTFSPQVWYSPALSPPFDPSSALNWQICQAMSSPPNKPVSAPYVTTQRPEFTLATMACSAKDAEGERDCAKVLVVELAKLGFGLLGSLSRMESADERLIVAPVVSPKRAQE